MNQPKCFLTTIFLFGAALCPIAATYAPFRYTIPLWILGFLLALFALLTALRRSRQHFHH